MRHHGDSLLKTATFEVLSEFFGKEIDFPLMKMISFAVSNAFYEQILLYYELENLRPQLSILHSKALTVQRGDVLEAYMSAIALDVSRMTGYAEVRNWLHKMIQLRFQKLLSACGRQVTPSTLGKSNGDAHRFLSHTNLLEFRQSIFDNLRKATAQIEWTATPTLAQLHEFWLKVKSHFDGICEKTLPSQKAEILLIHYYRVMFRLYLFLTL